MSVKLIVLLLVLIAMVSARVVHTTLGPVRGTADRWPHAKTVEVYRGIPYGAPPVGEKRFARPETAMSWNETRDAIHFAPDCWATGDGMSWSPNGMSEDCLYLNVFQPKDCSESDGLPLMIWFYGGGWNMGSATFPIYNGGNIIGSGEKKVVIATVNYRLGPFGFLASEELRSLSTTRSTGNMGILDQRLAMRFMKANARAFCADPNLITIWGESAGSGSVSNHLVMPGSKGLFNRAIMESGPVAGTWVADPMPGAQAQFNLVAATTGCAKSSNVVSCLQKVDVAQLNHNFRPPNTQRFTAYAPTIDGIELPDAPYLLGQQGKIYPVPILLGSNLNEGTMLVGGGGANLPIKHDLTEQGYLEFAESFFGNISAEVLALYPSKNYKSPWWAVTQIITDEAMTCASRRTARFAAAVNQPAYLYTFQHEVDIAKLDPYLGVFHGDDLVFTFYLRWFYPTWKSDLVPPVYIPLTPAEYHLQDTVLDYWYNFALTGNPNHQGQTSPQWPPAGKTGDPIIKLDLPVQPLDNWRDEFCDFWDKHAGFR